VGLLASNALGAWIVQRFGWQALYFTGGMPLILFFVRRQAGATDSDRRPP
jgi:MFS transporter, putative metabolite:H+ symporter